MRKVLLSLVAAVAIGAGFTITNTNAATCVTVGSPAIDHRHWPDRRRAVGAPLLAPLAVQPDRLRVARRSPLLALVAPPLVIVAFANDMAAGLPQEGSFALRYRWLLVTPPAGCAPPAPPRQNFRADFEGAPTHHTLKRTFASFNPNGIVGAAKNRTRNYTP